MDECAGAARWKWKRSTAKEGAAAHGFELCVCVVCIVVRGARRGWVMQRQKRKKIIEVEWASEKGRDTHSGSCFSAACL